MTSASLMHEAGHSKPALWDNPEDWGWEGGGRGVQDGGDICAPVADSCWCMAKPSQYCKIIILLKLTHLAMQETEEQGFNPWVWKFPWRRAWNPLQYSCLENPMDRGAWKSMESQRVRHNQATKHSTAQHIHIALLLRINIQLIFILMKKGFSKNMHVFINLKQILFMDNSF